MAKKILLSAVFGPYGVDDQYGRKENIMELFHNQVTKAQGPASLRFHHPSFGLRFLAENIKAPVTVLDFPTYEQFVHILQNEQFDAIGISFIVPNFIKAKEMARLIRFYQPHSEIILGGHGAAIEGIEKLIDCDHVVKGEGIGWLRRYLGEDDQAPIHHPVVISAENKRVFGIPSPGVCGLLVPGVGCVNGCRFCATTHFFGKTYTPFFQSGEDLYRQACRICDELSCDELFVMDENFLKDNKRINELLACMERDRRPLQFGIFSSAEAIESFGIENMVRLGVYFVWLGAESKHDIYEKNRGRDLKKLVRSLRDHGISVLVSGILFLEHHTKENIQEDIDYIVGLEGDFTQFMMFTPLPGTALYYQCKENNTIDFDLPYEEWHGQHLLNFKHPHFTAEEAREVLAQAFSTEFDRLSSSPYRMACTALRGIQSLEQTSRKDAWLSLRREQLKTRAEQLRLITPVMQWFAHDSLERTRVTELRKDMKKVLGPQTMRNRAFSWGAQALAAVGSVRRKFLGDLMQPKMTLTRYRWPSSTNAHQLQSTPSNHFPSRSSSIEWESAHGFK